MPVRDWRARCDMVGSAGNMAVKSILKDGLQGPLIRMMLGGPEFQAKHCFVPADHIL